MTETMLKLSTDCEDFYPKNYRKKSNLNPKEKELKQSNERSYNKTVCFKEYFPKSRMSDKQVHPLEKHKENYYPKRRSKFSKEKNEKKDNAKAKEVLDEDEDDYSGLAGSKFYSNNKKSSKWKSKGKKSEDYTNDFQSKWKTEMCHYWEMYGECKYGDACAFAHGSDELNKRKMSNNYKTKPCKQFFELGYCSYGVRCQFSHKPLKEFEKKEERKAKDEVSYVKILTEFNGSSNQISHEIIKRPRLMTFENIASCTLDEKEKNRLKLYEDILAVKKKESEEPEHVFSEDTKDENENSDNAGKNSNEKENEKIKREGFISI